MGLGHYTRAGSEFCLVATRGRPALLEKDVRQVVHARRGAHSAKPEEVRRRSLGGHQEGYSRPSDAHVGRPAAYVDKLLISGKGGVHHIWACDHYKTTLNADMFKQTYKRRTDIVKEAMSKVPAGDRAGQVKAILAAIKRGGLFSVDVDIVPTQIGQASHVWLPAATSGEMNLTSMNGERRMRLVERYMDPPGQAMPDCLIAARIANSMERIYREMGMTQVADKFKGFDWKTEEDAFMDGYVQHEKGGQFVSYQRLKAMGTNGFQEPATGFADGKIIGTKRLFADGKFGGKDGRATFMETKWRGLQAAGKDAERKKFAFLINNGRANLIWQNAYLDQQNDFVMDRQPFPYIELNPADMADLGLKQGDLVEVFNDNGSTQAMAYPTPSAKRKQAFMLFAYPTGVQGNVVSAGVNEFVIPNYKQTWGNIRKIADAPGATRNLSLRVRNTQRRYRTNWARKNVRAPNYLPMAAMSSVPHAHRVDSNPAECCDHEPLASVDAVQARILKGATVIEGRELVALSEAAGRIAAQDHVAPTALPRFDNSAMDGFALAGVDHCDRFRLVGRILAGSRAQRALRLGEAVRIFTGAPIPPGAEAVVMQEHAEFSDVEVVPTRRIRPGDNVRRAGEDVSDGEPLVRAGDRIDARAVAILASAGICQVSVRPKLKVCILSTGDELGRGWCKPFEPRCISTMSTGRCCLRRCGTRRLN